MLYLLLYMNNMKTAEFVSPMHPDKICDYIADSILDAYLNGDPKSRVAIEVMGGHNLITINGEVTSNSEINIESIVSAIVGSDYKIISNIVKQSIEIARGVDTGGAGDQGIMRGYATNATNSKLPKEYELARDLCQRIFEIYPYDGKTQVTINSSNIVTTIVTSFQNTKTPVLLELVKKIMREILMDDLQVENIEYLINPAGEWEQGGFDADTGLSGRKLIVDNYGPEIPIGGGSFSGKDYTKVDRSGAYMARKIAVDYLNKYNAKEVYVKLAYAIGKNNPVMQEAEIIGVNGTIENKNIEITEYDLSPNGILNALNLSNVKFQETCKWGHFGHGFNWDK